jgi:hypothetical protein
MYRKILLPDNTLKYKRPIIVKMKMSGLTNNHRRPVTSAIMIVEQMLIEIKETLLKMNIKHIVLELKTTFPKKILSMILT